MKSYMDVAIRILCGKTQLDLAEDADLGVNTIWRYENGESVRESTYIKIQHSLRRFSSVYMFDNHVEPSEFYARINEVLSEIDKCYKWIRPKNC